MQTTIYEEKRAVKRNSRFRCVFAERYTAFDCAWRILVLTHLHFYACCSAVGGPEGTGREGAPHRVRDTSGERRDTATLG